MGRGHGGGAVVPQAPSTAAAWVAAAAPDAAWGSMHGHQASPGRSMLGARSHTHHTQLGTARCAPPLGSASMSCPPPRELPVAQCSTQCQCLAPHCLHWWAPFPLLASLRSSLQRLPPSNSGAPLRTVLQRCRLRGGAHQRHHSSTGCTDQGVPPSHCWEAARCVPCERPDRAAGYALRKRTSSPSSSVLCCSRALKSGGAPQAPCGSAVE